MASPDRRFLLLAASLWLSSPLPGLSQDSGGATDSDVPSGRGGLKLKTVPSPFQRPDPMDPAWQYQAIEKGEGEFIYLDKDGKPLNRGDDMFPTQITPELQAQAVSRSFSYYGQGGGRNPDGSMRLGGGGMSVMPQSYEPAKDPYLQKAFMDQKKRAEEQQQKLEDKRAAKTIPPAASPPAGGGSDTAPIPGTEEELGMDEPYAAGSPPNIPKIAAYPTDDKLALAVPSGIVNAVNPGAEPGGPSVFEITERTKKTLAGGAGGKGGTAAYGAGAAGVASGDSRLGALGELKAIDEDLAAGGTPEDDQPGRTYQGQREGLGQVENHRKPPSVVQPR